MSPFSLQLPSLDHVLHQALELRGPRLIKVDISRAFRNIPIDRADALKCGIYHEGAYYLDMRLDTRYLVRSMAPCCSKDVLMPYGSCYKEWGYM